MTEIIIAGAVMAALCVAALWALRREDEAIMAQSAPDPTLFTPDIAYWNPLAPEGSAEWALYHVLHKERRALTGYVNDVLVHIQNTEYGIGLYYSGKIMPFDFITPEQFIEGAAHTGWQLYEEKPEPAKEQFAVGDWVYNKGIYGKLIDIDTQMNMGSIETADAVYADRDMDSMEKIDPSEVKVRVTLEGTVRKSQLNGCFVLDTPMPGNDVHTIRLVELDPNTAELVKALLKAQGGGE